MQIRPFDYESDQDYEQYVAVYNAVWPGHHMTIERIRFQDEKLVPGFLHARFVLEAGGKMVGSVTTGQTPGSFQPGKYWLALMVHPAVRGRGFGSAGYDYLLDFLQKQEDPPQKLTSRTQEDQPAGIAFLEKRGFECVMRYPQSRLDVAAFDPGRFADKVAAVEQSDLTISTLARLLDENPENALSLYDMMWDLLQDVPHPDPLTRWPYEVWEERLLKNPDLIPEGIFIARNGNELAGMTMLWRSGKDDLLGTGLTGVRRPYRRRGLATALKVRAIQYAQEHGFAEITTDNEENNPMFQLNLQLGFKPQPAGLDYVKHL